MFLSVGDLEDQRMRTAKLRKYTREMVVSKTFNSFKCQLFYTVQSHKFIPTFRRNELTVILSGTELHSGGVVLKTECVITQKFIVFSSRYLKKDFFFSNLNV
jgi:hypothetical protein